MAPGGHAEAMEYRLLGPVTVEDGTDAVALGGRRPRLLLATLLLQPNLPVAGSTLIEGVWGRRPPGRAPTAVRVVLAQLRRVLEPHREPGGPSILTHSPAGWVLSVPAGALDTERFEDLVARSRRAADGDRSQVAAELGRRALAEWRGRALADVVDDLDLAKGPALRWEELRLETLERTIRCELQLGRHEALTSELAGLVDAHPLREHLVSLLMVALYRSGRQAEALRVYEQARRRLVDELGLEPTAPLVELERAILLQEPDLDLPGPGGRPAMGRGAAVPLPAAVADIVRSGAMVGRDDDLARAAAAVEQAAAGQVATVVVSGAAGIGKSRLVAEVAASCHGHRGAIVLYGRCDPDPLVSYQPVVEALREHRGAGTGTGTGDRPAPPAGFDEVLAALTGVGRPAGAAGSDPEGGGRFALFESVVELLSGLAGGAGRPLVVVVEDLQWADEGTVALVRHLVRRLVDRSILMLLTTRSGEGPAGPGAAAVESGAEHSGRVHHLALRGLGAEAARELVSRAWGPDRGGGRWAGRIIDLAEGNPFFLRHLSQHLVAVGHLDDEAGLSLPTQVSSLVETLVASLGGQARRVLQVAAVQGREFDLDVVGMVAGVDGAALLDAVDELVAAQLVVEDGRAAADRYRFVHELVREVSYRQLGPGRRARLHGEIGGALEAVDDSQLLALSHHFSLAGRRWQERAGGYAALAGDQAMAALAFATAASQYGRAEQLARRIGRVGGRDHAELLVALGRARMSAGEIEAARAVFLEAIDLARRLDRPELVAQAAIGCSGDWGALDQSLGQPYVTLLEGVLAELSDGHAAIRARVAARLASVVLFRRGRVAAAGPSLAALRLAREQPDPGALAAALHVRHLVVQADQPLHPRLELADEELRSAERGSDVDLANALWDRTTDVMELGVAEEIDAMLAAYTRLADRGRAPLVWWAAVLAGSVATARGELAEAERTVAGAHARGVELRQPEAHRVHLAQLFVLRWLQGRLVELVDPPDRRPSEPYLDLVWHAALALWLAEGGDASGALRELRLLVAAFEWAPDPYLWMGSLAVAAEAVAVVGPPGAEVAGWLLERLEPYAGRQVVSGPGIAMMGPCDRYLGCLLAVQDQRAAAVDALRRAERLAVVAGAVPFALLARLDAALVEAGGPAPAPDVLAVLDRARHLGIGAVLRRARRAGVTAPAGSPAAGT